MQPALVFVCVVTLAAPALAQGRGRARFGNHSRVIVRVDDRGSVRVRSPRVIVVDDFGRSGRPHGWSHGRKVGWGGCDLPPGLAKKHGCYNSRIGLGRGFTDPGRYGFAQPRRADFVISIR